ncbi:MAG: hypothetical protein QM715_09570 [Nibricoccus sp.]
MQTKLHSPIASGLFAGAILATAVSAYAADAVKPDTDPLPNITENYIKLSGQGSWISGDKAAYEARTWTAREGFAGIEDFQITKDLGNDFGLTVDGHALLGNQDFLGQVKISKNELGSFDMGYKRFRTYYDGVGGFFPTNNAWFPLTAQVRHVDRSKFWVGGAITLPNLPVLTLRYTNELRNGSKDTTIWGDTDFTGVPIWSSSALNPVSANRKIVASYIDLNERQETFEAALKHSFGNTTVELEAVYVTAKSDDTRWVNRYPGELKPLVAIPATPATLVPPALANNPVYGFDRQMSEPKIITYTGKFETQLTSKIGLHGGVSFQHATAKIGGDRQMFLKIATGTGVQDLLGGFTPGGRPPYSYTTLAGDTTQDVLTANLCASYKPTKDLYVSLGLKGEDLDMEGNNQVVYKNTRLIQATGVSTSIPIDAPNTAERSERSWTPELNVRYTGIRNVSLYTTVDYRYVTGDEIGSSVSVTTVGSGASGTVGPSLAASFNNAKENHGHYKVGANWNACAAFTLRAEVFYKDHRNSYTGYGTSVGGQYVLGYEYTAKKLTGIVKVLPTLTVTGRYVGRDGEMDTAVDFEEKYQSMDFKSHDFGVTVDWTPIKQFYAQANVDLVFDTTSTAYPRAGGAANDVLRNADNNHWTASAITGVVLDKVTNAELQYTRYKASNYEPLYATTALGASQDDYTVTVGVKRKLSDNLVAEAKVGYLSSKVGSTGGNTNYSGYLAYLTLQQGF